MIKYLQEDEIAKGSCENGAKYKKGHSDMEARYGIYRRSHPRQNEDRVPDQ